ncbi:ImmA/IrrE family metallo-endopeptidase [Bifidobacterium animalis]|uniref:ImmA/IrrE family metallo-endopeptidase n=1 Tax=Bifidobacterium animalis TaxID=28025 RepID=UPI003F8F7C4A
MTVEELLSYAQAHGLHVTECPLPGTLCGLYDDTTRTIYLHDRLNARQRRCTLLHELIHAHYHDSARTGPYGAREERRTRRLTASTLISMPEYRLAERIYEGDVYRMACELEVTVQVLRDYQAMLAEQSAAITTQRAYA